MADFGERLRELRKQRGLTLRELAETVGVDFTYLSKIENSKAGYLPGADTIRGLADALSTDALELLQLADKVPPEMESFTASAKARRFLQRAKEASPADWDALLSLLEERQQNRSGRKRSERND